MEKVIVIGAFSFLGFHLTKKLLEEGITVYGLDLEQNEGSYDQKEEKQMSIGRNANLHYVSQKDREHWNPKINEKIDTLFFTIDLPSDKEQAKPGLVEKYLYEAIEYCHLHSTRFIFLSTTEIVAHKETFITEQTHISPLTTRGERYLTLEEIIQAQNSKQALSFLILRLPTLYGPWQPDTFAFQQVLRLLEEGKDVGWVDDKYIGDVLYVEDAIEAIKKAANCMISEEIIHITTGNSGEWLKGMNYLLGRKNNEENFSNRLSNKKAEELLSFRPCITIEEGLSKQRSHIRLTSKKNL
ncbi:NAD-dependent epimerase/dehydratase family protein [Bacillus sp. DJP31]|uniref:NAD-dependent epimerase/dehydratase family protein n=1 Tax=Bacillus sp. DJP31 TaxID=3409789 RepID=UPI003BB7346E